MSLAQLPLERRPSANPLPLSSNNPFRRGISPTTPSTNPPPPPYTVNNGPAQQASRNPFLDNFQAPRQYAPQPIMQRQRSPPKPMPPGVRYEELPRQQNTNPADLFQDLSLSDRSGMEGHVPPRGPFPPRNHSYTRHRPTHSQEEARRARMAAQNSREEEPVNIFATPPKTADYRRNRRNSDTSIIDVKEEERKQRDRDQRRRDRDAKHRGLKLAKPRKPNPQMDIIDKLDVSSIYGSGLFHHDGPFDACNPHRNRKGMKDAPMQAFPEGSANNVLGGRGPVNKTMDIDKFHGRGAEGFTDFNDTTAAPPVEAPAPVRRPERTNTTERPAVPERPPVIERPAIPERPFPAERPYVPERSYTAERPYMVDRSYATDGQYAPERPAIIDPKGRTDQVYGEESAGLGATTFLEGAPAPASRIAMQQREVEIENNSNNAISSGPTLQRKKSLAQRIRGMSRPRQGMTDGPRVTSPEARYVFPDSDDIPPLPSGAPQSAGGRGRMHEVNPFFSEESAKDANVKIPDVNFDLSSPRMMRSRTMSSPQRPLFRMKTSDSINGGGEAEAKNSSGGGVGSGLLNRVRSIRGGRRPKGDRRES